MDYRDYDTRLAAYAVITDDAGRILLALWNEATNKLWTLPGGGVDLDETTEDAAVREVEEETGHDVRLTALLGVDCYVVEPERRFKPSDRPLKGVRVIYRAEIVGGSLRNETGGSTDEARWIPLADVPDLPRSNVVDRGLVFAGLIPGQEAP